MTRIVKLVVAGIAVGVLSGCATYDYYGYGYNEPYYSYSRPYYGYSYDPYYYGYSPYYYDYGPGYYGGPPAVGFNFTYRDRDHRYRSDRRHDGNWSGDRNVSRSNTVRPAPTTQRSRTPAAKSQTQARAAPATRSAKSGENERFGRRAAMRADSNRTDTATR